MFAGAPFGLKQLTSIFQRVTTKICQPFSFAHSFVDNIVVTNAPGEDHIDHLIQTIDALTAQNLTFNLEKCKFGYTAMRSLGHFVTNGGLLPDPTKVAALPTWPQPKKGRDVHQFLGMMNFLRPFVPNFSAVANPLYPLTSIKGDLGTNWTKLCQDSFDNLRALLTKAPLLRLPDFNRKFFVATDASQYGLGAALFQTTEEHEADPISSPVGERKYIALISRSLTKGDRGYSATKRELLAIVFAQKRLRYYLWGHRFHLFTDHSALTYMFTQTHTNPLIEGWFETLLDFQFDISHCPGV
jgi:hypothetical protein